MQFLTPLFLLAAVSVAIPIILHLTRRETRNPIPFASLMFLRRLPVQEVRKRKLRNLFLLLLRCLALVLLVIAFAQPVLQSAWLDRVDPTQSRSIAIAIDSSLSMSQPGLWERAVDEAISRINQLSVPDEAVIVQFADTASVLSPWQSDFDALRQTVQSLEGPGFHATSYAEGIRAAVAQLEEASHDLKELVLITDLQASGLDLSERFQIPPGIQIEVVDVGSDDASNLYIDEVRLSREVFGDQYPHSVVVRVSSSPPAAQSGEISLFLESELVDRQSFQLDDSGSATVNFPPFEVPEGKVRGRLVVDANDSVSSDDSYYFVLERLSPDPIYFWSRQTASETVYFESALSAGRNLPFTMRPISNQDVLTSDSRSVLVIDDSPSPPRLSALQSHLEKGGGVLIAVGNSTSAETYGALDSIMPATLSEKKFARSQGQPFVSITDAAWEHPIFSIFQESQKSSLTSVQFYGYWSLDPKPQSHVLARFSTGEPALVEASVGQGRVLLFASSMDRVWSDFPLKSSYLPFWQQAVHYASARQGRPPALRVSQVLSLSDWAPNEPGRTRSWDVLDPTGRRVLALDEERPDYLQLERAGYYEIRSNKDTDWVAVNSDPLESNLSRIKQEELLAAITRTQVRSEGGTHDTLESNASGRSLWWLVLLLAAVIFLVESIVANRTRTRRTAPA